PWSGTSWRERLQQIVSFNDKESVSGFINTTVHEAFSDLQKEFAKNGIVAKINFHENPKRTEIEIKYDVVNNFIYGVMSDSKIISDYLINEDNLQDIENKCTFFLK